MTMYESTPPTAHRFQKKEQNMVVIKLGGSILQELPDYFYQELLMLQKHDWYPIIVHGGGPAITKMLQRLGISSSFVNGLRVTDEQTLDVVQMVLNGKENKEIVKKIQSNGGLAIGLSGIDGGMIEAEVLKPELGYVGQVKSISIQMLSLLQLHQIIPVISPLGIDQKGQIYNINADTVAQAIATKLNASKLIMISDIPGIYQEKNGKKEILHHLTLEAIDDLIEKGQLTGGMIPKVEAAIQCIKDGTNEVYILDGREKGIFSKLLNNKMVGTKILKKAVML